MSVCFGIGEPDGRDLSNLEELIWNPDSGLQDKQIENFQLLARFAILLSIFCVHFVLFEQENSLKQRTA